jgi:23S rRNA (guanosine2251-2'-O)-methyltransferase
METGRKLSMGELGRLSPDEFAETPKLPVAVVLDNVRSLHNVGSIFRTCDAFAMEKLHLCGITASPPNREMEKTALGATETVPWRHWPTTMEAIRFLKNEGYTVIAAEQVAGSAALHDFPFDGKKNYAVIFGHEVHGVSQDVIDLCDHCVEIPQLGTKHSLNVAVSAGVVLWELFRHLRQ